MGRILQLDFLLTDVFMRKGCEISSKVSYFYGYGNVFSHHYPVSNLCVESVDLFVFRFYFHSLLPQSQT